MLTQKIIATTNNGTEGLMQIEGVPEGWEAVAFRKPVSGEWVLDARGTPSFANAPSAFSPLYLIIRRVEPVCTWQHGMFADGWIAEDSNRSLWMYSTRPSPEEEGWVSRYNDGYCMRLNKKCFVNPPVFRSDLPWTSRIQQVGPTIESTLKVMT